MLQPLRLLPDTKMPQFMNEDGTSDYDEYLDGDGQKQLDGFRRFFVQLSQIPQTQVAQETVLSSDER